MPLFSHDYEWLAFFLTVLTVSMVKMADIVFGRETHHTVALREDILFPHALSFLLCPYSDIERNISSGTRTGEHKIS